MDIRTIQETRSNLDEELFKPYSLQLLNYKSPEADWLNTNDFSASSKKLLVDVQDIEDLDSVCFQEIEIDTNINLNSKSIFNNEIQNQNQNQIKNENEKFNKNENENEKFNEKENEKFSEKFNEDERKMNQKYEEIKTNVEKWNEKFNKNENEVEKLVKYKKNMNVKSNNKIDGKMNGKMSEQELMELDRELEMQLKKEKEKSERKEARRKILNWLSENNIRWKDKQEFIVLKECGFGSFGVIVQAKHIKTGEMCALKRISLRRHADTTEKFLERMDKEYLLVTGSNLVSIYGIVKEEFYQDNIPRLSLWMEYLPLNLKHLIEFHKLQKKAIPIQIIKSLIYQLFCGLKTLHSNKIVHADIKPNNILIDFYSGALKICDFGLSSFLNQSSLLNKQTQSNLQNKNQSQNNFQSQNKNSSQNKNNEKEKEKEKEQEKSKEIEYVESEDEVGTRGYKSPEIYFHEPDPSLHYFQFTNNEKIVKYRISCGIDVFSAGIIIYELFHPFKRMVSDRESDFEYLNTFGSTYVFFGSAEKSTEKSNNSKNDIKTNKSPNHNISKNDLKDIKNDKDEKIPVKKWPNYNQSKAFQLALQEFLNKKQLSFKNINLDFQHFEKSENEIDNSNSNSNSNEIKNQNNSNKSNNSNSVNLNEKQKEKEKQEKEKQDETNEKLSGLKESTEFYLKMLSWYPMDRPSVAEILQDKWFESSPTMSNNYTVASYLKYINFDFSLKH